MVETIAIHTAYDEMWPVEKLRPNPQNPNKHSEAQIEILAELIGERGWRAPLTVSNRSGLIVKGHARLAAAMKLDCKEVPVDLQDFKSEQEELEELIGDNKIAEFAELDRESILALEEEHGIDLSLAAFDELEIEELTGGDEEEVVEDDPPDVPEEPITQPGDLWLLGSHRVYCGDSKVPKDLEALMDGEEAEMVFTDPPYNVNYGEKASMLNDYQKGHRNTSAIQNDHMESPEFLAFLTDCFGAVYDVLKPGGAFYVCHAESTALEFRLALKQTGYLVKQCLVWAKNTLVIGRQDYQWKHEPILYGWKPGAGHRWHGGRKNTTLIEDEDQVSIVDHGEHKIINVSFGLQHLVLKVPSYEIEFAGDDSQTTVWRVEKPLKNDVHPTMKPVALCARAISNSTKPGDLVLDTFAGSGSTLIAAEQLGRKCNLLELDPKYCDVIVERWENFTGKKAERIPGGKE